jgi:uncharacterized membrane protein YhaH (DUF805 family)
MSDRWTLTSEQTAILAHDALLAARGAKKAQMAPADPIPALHAGGALYEPSQAAPRHNGILFAVIVVLTLLGALAGLVRRLREPLGMAAFALIVAVAAIMATRGGR